MPTTVIDTIGSDGGRDYATIQAWETATRGDLVAADEVRIGECYRDDDDGFTIAGAEVVDIAGSTTDSTRYRELRAASGQEWKPYSRTGVFVTKTWGASTDEGFDLAENFFRMSHIGLFVDNALASSSGSHAYIRVTGGADMILDSLSIMPSDTARDSGFTAVYGIRVEGGSNLNIWNTSVSGSAIAKQSLTDGISVGTGFSSGFLRVYNCSVFSCVFDGVSQGVCYRLSPGGAVIITSRNNLAASSNFNDWIIGTAVVTHCTSSDASVPTTSNTNLSNIAAGQLWINPLYQDFRNRFDSPAVNDAFDLSSTFTQDADNVTRLMTWERGPYDGFATAPTATPTTVTKTIGSGAGRDYATVQAWADATDKHLVFANEVQIGLVYDDSDFLENTISIAGAVSDATRYRELKPASAAHRYDPITDTGWKNITSNGTGASILIDEDFFRMSGVGVDVTDLGATAVDVIRIQGSDCVVDACFVELDGGASGARRCFQMESGERSVFRNCIAKGGNGSGSSAGFRIEQEEGACLNCLAYQIDQGASGAGFIIDSGVDNGKCRIWNCLAIECDTDFSSNVNDVNQLNNTSSDTTAVGQGATVSETAANLFNDAPNDDFRLKPSASAVNTGFALNFDFTTDFVGATRFAPWERGVYDGFASPPLFGAVFIGAEAHRLCTLWRIERQDGTAFLFTDANEPVPYQGQSYTPTNALTASALRTQSGLRDSSREFVGGLDSSLISDTDLAAGRYRGAVVRERVVDFEYPWAESPVPERIWRVGKTQFDGETWVAEVTGLAERLQQRVGPLNSVSCGNVLGDKRCKYNIAADIVGDVELNNVIDDRREFGCSDLEIPSAFVDDYFGKGYVIWLTGLNAGMEFEVKEYTKTGRILKLTLRTPFAIASGDRFRLEPGCRLRFLLDCVGKYNNPDNFNGRPHMPGTDKALETPTL